MRSDDTAASGFEAPDSTTVLVVDPIPLVRLGVATLAAAFGLDDCVHAHSVAEAVELAGVLRPRLVVHGDAPQAALLGAVGRIASASYRPLQLVLVGPADGAAVAVLLAAGADGVARRYGPVDELEVALAAVLDGARHVAASLVVELPGRIAASDPDVVDIREADGALVLSARERDMLVFLAQGLSNREIAAALSISLATVKTHLMRVYTKLGVNSRAEALGAAVERRLLL